MLKKLKNIYRTEGLHGFQKAIRRRLLRLKNDTINPENDNFNRLVSFIDKLNRNCSNQLGNLNSSAEVRPWNVDKELSGIVRSLKPEIYLADPNAPAICSVALGSEYQAAVAPCLKATREYCARHKYNYLLLTQSPPDLHRPETWAKVCLLFYALEHEYKNIMWLDADALIKNVEVTLESFNKTLEQADKTILVAEDYYGINMGVFFLRAGWKSRILLNLMWCNRLFISSYMLEQGALVDLMRRHPEVAGEAYIEPRCRSFNSRASELAEDPKLAWQPGDFIIHFAGARERQKLSECIARYSEL